MTPIQVSIQLRRIASIIQNAKNPQRDLVAKDLKKIIAAMDDQVKLIDISTEIEEIVSPIESDDVEVQVVEMLNRTEGVHINQRDSNLSLIDAFELGMSFGNGYLVTNPYDNIDYHIYNESNKESLIEKLKLLISNV